MIERIRSSENMVKSQIHTFETPSSLPASPEVAARRVEIKFESNGKDSRRGGLEEHVEIEQLKAVSIAKKKEKATRKGSWRQVVNHHFFLLKKIMFKL